MGAHTSQSGRSQLAARIAAQVATRQAEEAARLETLRQTLFPHEPTPKSAWVKDDIAASPARRSFGTPAELAAFLASSPLPPDLHDADFLFAVDLGPSGTLFNLLAEQLPSERRLDKVLLGANLSGATFHHGLGNVDLSSANLTGARFEGPVERVCFLSTDLTRSDFSASGGVRDTDFAFSTLTDVNLPADVDTTGSVFTGTPRSPEPLLSSQVRVNEPSLLASLACTADPAEQQRRIRAWAAEGSLFHRLVEVLPRKALDGVLTREWRIRLHEELQGHRPADNIHFELKALLFDAVDGRHGLYERPLGGPTLRNLYAYEASDCSQHLQRFIDRALADMLAADIPVSLARPVTVTVRSRLPRPS